MWNKVESVAICEVIGRQTALRGLVIFIDILQLIATNNTCEVFRTDLILLEKFARIARYERPKLDSHSAFVDALIHWRKLNSWRKKTELFDNHNELQRPVTGRSR
jgi:hypothetical protein